MLVALAWISPGWAWLGDDGAYRWSRSGSGDADAPAHLWVDVPSDSAAVVLPDPQAFTFAGMVQSLAATTSTEVSFYGRRYPADLVSISVHGLILFGRPASPYSNSYCCSGLPMPEPFVSEPAIAVSWSGYDPTTAGDVWVLETPEELIVHWEGVPFFPAGGTNTFQVGLRPDGSIRISVDEQVGFATGVSIGLQSEPSVATQVYFSGVPPTGPVTWLFVVDASDDDGDGYANFDDCDDTNAGINPSVVDTACNGVVLGCAPLLSEDDFDGDGVRACAGDCDDADPGSHPFAVEVCDLVDNDCDGVVDNGLQASIFTEDADWDGFGSPTGAMLTACSPPFGFGPPTDCDDADPQVNPAAFEDCDPSTDWNCDGDPQAGAFDALIYQDDADGDGFGALPTRAACELPPNIADQPGDCDDADAAVNPDAEEVPLDGIDQNCDGREDDDRDEDGLSDADEHHLGYDWLDPDSDDDGVLDGVEYQYGMSALNPDSDGDGIGDATEFGVGAPPDTDGDGLVDANDPDDDGDTWPTAVEGTGDPDGDGVPNHLDLDSDGDGVPDAQETALGRLDAAVPGTDGEREGCGCAAAPGPVGALLLVPLALARRSSDRAVRTVPGGRRSWARLEGLRG